MSGKNGRDGQEEREGALKRKVCVEGGGTCGVFGLSLGPCHVLLIPIFPLFILVKKEECVELESR